MAEPPRSTARQIRLLWRNVRRAIGIAWKVEPGLTGRYVAASIVNAVLPVAIAWVGKQIVDSVVAAIDAPGHPTEDALTWVAVELGLILLTHTSGQYLGYASQLLRTRLALHVDAFIFEKTLSLSLKHFEDPKLMDVVERARKESSWRPLEMITQGLSLGRSVLTLTGYCALLLSFSVWAVLALLLASLPFLADTRFAAGQYAMRVRRTQDERRAYYLQQLLTADYHVKEIKLFALGSWLLGKHRALFERFYEEDREFARKRGAAVTVFGALSVLVFYGIYVVIVGQTAAGVITLGSMTLYLTVFRQGQRDFQGAMLSLARAYEDNLYMENLFELLAVESDDVARVTPSEAKLDASGPSITFEDVEFRYPGSDRTALSAIDLEIRAGETIALVGPNGAGKTSLIKLLVGLYPPTRGRVLIDGEDIASLDPGELRARIGVLFQDFVHYHFTVQENVGLGWMPEIDDRARAKEAAEMAGADATIEGLPDGYGAMLGRWFGGEELSVGQWQRLALARAFMRKSKILVLDEPTAALDAEGEHEIFERFAELKKDATAILITHRFSSVPMADRIVVLDDGRVVETGTHAELLAEGGLYARMWNLQAKSYLEAGVRTPS